MAGKNHVGKAGQLATMAEFLLHGYNVAMPEVDTGDDIFVVHDTRGQLWRIQVKTAIGKATRHGYRGQFAVGLKQLQTIKEPDLYYVFALRQAARWEFLVITREQLWTEHRLSQVGTVSSKGVVFTLRFHASDVICSGRGFQVWRNNWSEWPNL